MTDRKNDKTDLPDDFEQESPGSDIELGLRVKAMVNQYPDQSTAAKAAGVSLSTLKRYMAGKDPGFRAVYGLATGSDTNLDWVATGHGPMRRGQPGPDIDDDLMLASMMAIDDYVLMLQIKATPRAKAEAALQVYREWREEIVKNGRELSSYRTLTILREKVANQD